MNANCDAPVKTSSDEAIACAGLSPAATASAPNDTPNVPTASPIAAASRTTGSFRAVVRAVRAILTDTIVRGDRAKIAIYSLQ